MFSNSRNPSTGENKLYGEYLIDAQGEDVVAGIRTPDPISKLQTVMPSVRLTGIPFARSRCLLCPTQVYKDLLANVEKLEHHYKDMQDIEFTIQEGRLFMLQVSIIDNVLEMQPVNSDTCESSSSVPQRQTHWLGRDQGCCGSVQGGHHHQG